jgi:hypothetical protein
MVYLKATYAQVHSNRCSLRGILALAKKIEIAITNRAWGLLTRSKQQQ